MGFNLRGVTLGIEMFLSMIRSQRTGGRICAMSSLGGLGVTDDGGIYSSAKYGVVVLMECLRPELAEEGIGVGVLCPAVVNTNIHDRGSMPPPELADTELKKDPEQQRAMKEMTRLILAMEANPLRVGE